MHPQQNVETPAERTFGLDAADWDDMTVVQQCPKAVLDEHGTLPVGALSLLIDHACGIAIARRLEAHQQMITQHMHLEVLRQPSLNLNCIIGRHTAVDFVPGSAFATGEAMTTDGLLIARFSARFVVFSGGEQAGGVVTDAVPPTVTNADLVAHEWTGSPIHQVLGTQIVAVERGRVRLTVRATQHLANERYGVHGGVGGIIGDRAGELAVRSIAGADHHYRPVEMRVIFVRPIAASGTDLAVDAEVGFFGRTRATTTARVYRPDGKLAIQVDAVHTVQV